jgi:hypothetical protein
VRRSCRQRSIAGRLWRCLAFALQQLSGPAQTPQQAGRCCGLLLLLLHAIQSHVLLVILMLLQGADRAKSIHVG